MQATAAAAAATKEKKKKKLPRLEEFIQTRDFAGAITLLEVCRTSPDSVFGGNPWQPINGDNLIMYTSPHWPSRACMEDVISTYTVPWLLQYLQQLK